jgi:FkbM family methyltransferase
VLPYRQVWIDVGAHRGETTLLLAALRRRLVVYAFEPVPRLAAELMGRYRNYVVLPFAVSERNEMVTFNIAADDATGSLLPFDKDVATKWNGGDRLRTVATTTVPSIRLDTFLDNTQIAAVDFLKVDAQGTDLAVIRSAGDRIRDVRRIKIEVPAEGCRAYEGSHSKAEVLDYLQTRGFVLGATKVQSFGQEENLTFVQRR